MKNFIYLILSGALAFASCSKDDPAPVEVGEVKLNKTTLTLAVGEEQPFTATVLPDNAENKTVTWSSSDTKIATVSDAGLVKAVAEGSATITATADGKSATCAVTVKSVTLDKTELTLHRTDTETLTATVLPDDAPDPKVVWTTSDGAVATVSEGIVTAVAPGKATITAASGDQSATCAVTVEPDVYVIGHDRNRTSTDRKNAILWKNGVPTELPFWDVYNGGIKISDGDVYVAGVYGNPYNASVGVMKNEVLTEWSKVGYDISFFVSGEDEYLAFSRGGRAIIHKNKIETTLDPDLVASTYSVVVLNGDVYVGGRRIFNKGGHSATYWKNGVATDLTDGTWNAAVLSMTIADGVIYAVGYQHLSPGDAKAVLWKDWKPTDLPEGYYAYDVSVSGKGDVYVAGKNQDEKPVFWKNGVPTQLPIPEGSSDAGAYAIFAYDDDVYVAGWDNDYAVLWKNGVPERLSSRYDAVAVVVY